MTQSGQIRTTVCSGGTSSSPVPDPHLATVWYRILNRQLSELSCKNNKNSISYISGIFSSLSIFTLSTVPLQRAAWTSMKTSQWKQNTGILWLGCHYMIQIPDKSKLPTAQDIEVIQQGRSVLNQTVSRLLESQWRPLLELFIANTENTNSVQSLHHQALLGDQQVRNMHMQINIVQTICSICQKLKKA